MNQNAWLIRGAEAHKTALPFWWPLGWELPDGVGGARGIPRVAV